MASPPDNAVTRALHIMGKRRSEPTGELRSAAPLKPADTPVPAAVQGDDVYGGEAEGQASPQDAPESRTTVTDGQSCRQCGGPIRGKRRNGLCSDRCRMRCRRREKQKTLEELFETAERALADLRREVLP